MKGPEAQAARTGGRHRRWAQATWFCIAVAVLPWVALPLVQALVVESAIATTFSTNPGLTVQGSAVDGIDAFNAFERRVDDSVAAHLGSSVVQTTAFATLGPLHLSDIGGLAPTPGASSLQITPTYVDHLATHVDVLAGDLPAEGLGGGDPAVTMPQAGADKAGLRMSDHFCLDSTGGAGRQSHWCARVVGLWRPVDGSDPVWGGTPPQLQLMLSRHDFFELAGTLSPRHLVAGVRYQANPYAVDRQLAGQVPDQVRALRQDLARQPGFHLDTTLDRSVDGLLAQLAGSARLMRFLTAVMVLVTLALVAVVVRCFLDQTAGELAVRGPVEYRAAGRLGLLAVLALPVGVAGGLLAAGTMLIVAPGVALTWLHPSDLVEVAVTAFAGLCALFATLAFVGTRTRDDVEIAEPMAPTTKRIRSRRRAGAGLALATLGAMVMLALYFSMSEGPVRESAALAWLPPAAAVALLGGAALCLVPLMAGVPILRHSDLAGTLASLQFERRPDQHSSLALFLFLAVAAGTFAAASAIKLAAGNEPAALQYGAEWGLLMSLLIALISVPIGFGLHFRATAKRRLVEYASLFAHHLPARTVGDTMGAEQAVILWPSLIAGVVVGIALDLVMPAGAAVSVPISAAAVAAVAAAAIVLARLAGRPARHLGEAGW